MEYESSGDKEYLDKIKPYLRDIIINIQKSDTQKIQLTISINFNSSKDVDEKCVIHLKSNNKEFMAYDDANEVADEVFESLLSRYQISLEISMKGSDFIFDLVKLLRYKCYKINFKLGESILILQTGQKKKSNNKSEKLR